MSFIFGVADFDNRDSIDLMMLAKDGKGDIYITNFAVFKCSNKTADENESTFMTLSYGERIYTIMYNGKIYNKTELKRILEEYNVLCRRECTEELILRAYIIFGEKCLNKIKGDIIFCVYDEQSEQLFVASKGKNGGEICYIVNETAFVFSSEPERIQKYLKDRNTGNKKHRINVMKSGAYGYFDRNGFRLYREKGRKV